LTALEQKRFRVLVFFDSHYPAAISITTIDCQNIGDQ